MKNAAKLSLTLILWFVSSIILHGASLLFEFSDPVWDIFLPVGDVSHGVVEIDTSDGAYTVTLYEAGIGFNYSMLIELNLINNSDSIRAGVVTLSGEYVGNFLGDSSISFSGYNAGLIGWMESDPILMKGEFDNSFYTSATYSVDGTVLYDELPGPGYLMPDPNGIPDPNEEPSQPGDSDNDGVPDEVDLNDESDFSETISFLGSETAITNITDADFLAANDGLTLADVIVLMEAYAFENAPNHGQYVQELVRNFKMLEKDELISKKDNSKLVRLIVQNRK